MARPGRPAKPVERHRKAGNPSKKSLPAPVTVLPALEGPPKPPEGLRDAGRGPWEAVWDDGQAWLAPTDAPLVAMLAEAADEREAFRVLVAEEGATFTTEKGYKGLHPAVGQLRALEKHMVTCLSLLGFSPSDRSRLGLAEVKRMSHLADLVSRRREEVGR